MKYFLLLCTLLFTVHTSFAAPLDTQSVPQRSERYAYAEDGTPLTWTVYTPPGRGPWPAVLVIHGGGFYGGDPNDFGVAGCAQDLAAAGYIAFAITYRLAPPGSIPGQRSLGRFPDQYNDVHLAVLAARNDSRCNGQVGAVGGSAGGTHTAWVAATGQRSADRIDVGVCLSGAYDFSDFRPDDHLSYFMAVVTNYVGVPSTDTASLREASPAWVLNRSISPLSMFDTVGDLVPSVQLDDMVAKLNVAGVTNFQAETIPGTLHSFAYWPQVKDDAIAFLAKEFNKRSASLGQ
jgi:acetyl esterase/lipase